MPKLKNILKVIPQYLVPQHSYSRLLGAAMYSKNKMLKQWCINTFIKRYGVNMDEAQISDPNAYPNFQEFFIRHLKPGARTITNKKNHIACPVDGTLSASGKIKHNTLFQAKNHDYTLAALLGGDKDLTKMYKDGFYSTIYLAPKDYHRVHMPLSGTLKSMHYIPGRLFSVNPLTAETIPNLFARNERVVSHFETAFGPMAVIMIGAMIVGGIKTDWAGKVTPPHRKKPFSQSYENINLEKGKEMGYFCLGSTVVLLFGNKDFAWQYDPNDPTLKMGQSIGIFDGNEFK